jgi:tRNA-specific 2-thiouridylase
MEHRSQSTGSRVLVAMSGGVDSSVTAALLLEAGHEVIGVTYHLWDAEGARRIGRCCTPEDRDDARKVADRLGVPHYVLDQRDAFRTHVVDPFVEEYLEGRTPSPCVHCNRNVKLGPLVDLADRLGAQYVATGHYARVVCDPEGRPHLLRGLDEQKDQSYFLFGVPDRVLSRLILPLGDQDKGETRRHAHRLGLITADKPDSQELCFVPDGDIGDFVRREGRELRPGLIKDEDGETLGRHNGIAWFTVGQRRGLGLGGQDRPRYVLRIVPERDEVVVGPHEHLHSSSLRATQAHWVGHCPEKPFRARVRIRHRHAPAEAEVQPEGEGFVVRFDEPQRAVTPGQAAVVYEGDEVIGGGFITS